MFSQPKMIDRATGASPPWPNTKEMASSPIHLDPTIEITMSNDHYDDDLASIDRVKQSVEKIMAMNDEESIVAFPSPQSNASANSTPLLSSCSSIKPMPLMSIDAKANYGVSSSMDSSGMMNKIIDKSSRSWPVDPPYRYNYKYRHQRIRATGGRHKNFYHPYYGHQCTARHRCTSSSNNLLDTFKIYMNLRKKNFPPKFWLQLHNHTIDCSQVLPPKKHRNPSKIKVSNCLDFLSPHIQKFIYSGAIDKRKGEIRANKFPLSNEQYTVMNRLGVIHKYQSVFILQSEFQLEYNFIHKGYHRGVENIQFRLQKQKPIVDGKNPILILRVRFHQKAPILKQ
ncbi:unnamed protein product [Rotaria magnacalcarata]|uniref:Uncharacterized protein n=2 Tax=Rotaria magnacalcarata TaxID=392030 RepID=A0A816QXA9_9BILA|nr:unnamed protein product [Rotaria magnacalcarata]